MIQKNILQDIYMGGSNSGGGLPPQGSKGSNGIDYVQSSKREIASLKLDLIELTDENVELLKRCNKLQSALDKVEKKEKVYI